MRILLDTHALLWWFSDDPSLTQTARKHIGDARNEVLISAATAWEIATKVRLGRLPTGSGLAAEFIAYLNQAGFQVLTITADHGIRAGSLPGPHKDPFDRMLIAQAQAEHLAIVSADLIFDEYGVRRLW